MKNFCLLAVFALIVNAGLAQDTIRGQVIRVDTVKIQQVRVDTVYVPQENAQPQAQKTNEGQQQENKQNEKVYFGGYGNFSIGKYTSIGFEPLIGYKLLPRFSVGAKLSYEYFKNKNYTPKKEGSNYGIGAFSRLFITQRIYGHAEFSEMNYKIYQTVDQSNRQWISFLYVGGGYNLPVAKGVSLNAEVLWDVLQNDDSPYKTVEPFFNVGIAVGF
ncbi:hypothetical protein [Maribellus sediminis]|uniref:hypothetical protein n=1 Tax=Maribellus sediminis TaxID=2696285 RepID=UPI00143088E4|nr:hypothetical protein [Maribellus sediminis]